MRNLLLLAMLLVGSVAYAGNAPATAFDFDQEVHIVNSNVEVPTIHAEEALPADAEVCGFPLYYIEFGDDYIFGAAFDYDCTGQTMEDILNTILDTFF